MKEVIAVALLLVAAFCVYGFVASTEPGPNRIYYRVGYPLVAIICLAIAVASLIKPRR